MKRIVALCWVLLFTTTLVIARDHQFIRISTNETDLVLQTAPNGRLYQTYLGAKLTNNTDFDHLSYFGKEASPTRGWEVYPASGAEDYFEPAFAVQHSDGNMTSIFKYVSHQTTSIDGNVTRTVIELEDELYPVRVKLYYESFAKENILKTWTEISHKEKKPVTISRYASSMLYFESGNYHLTEFSGDWAKEVQMSTQQLQFGKKLIDTKLGSRAGMFTSPFFQLGFDKPAEENSGDVLMGTIAWTGNFQFTFEVDNLGNLRVLSASTLMLPTTS